MHASRCSSAFLDAVEAHGRNAVLMEDQNEEPQTYGQILRMSLALSRLLQRLTSKGENVGVLLPNVVPAVGVVMGLSAPGVCRPFSITRRARWEWKARELRPVCAP